MLERPVIINPNNIIEKLPQLAVLPNQLGFDDILIAKPSPSDYSNITFIISKHSLPTISMNTLVEVGFAIDKLLNIKNDEYPIVKILEYLRPEHFEQYYSNNTISLINSTVNDIQLFLNKLDIKINSNEDYSSINSSTSSFHHQQRVYKTKSKADSTLDLEEKYSKLHL